MNWISVYVKHSWDLNLRMCLIFLENVDIESNRSLNLLKIENKFKLRNNVKIKWTAWVKKVYYFREQLKLTF